MKIFTRLVLLLWGKYFPFCARISFGIFTVSLVERIGFSTLQYKKIPLSWSETKEEEKADEEDEGDGAADVGDGSDGGDGHGHGFLRCLHHQQGGQSDPAEQSLGVGGRKGLKVEEGG